MGNLLSTCVKKKKGDDVNAFTLAPESLEHRDVFPLCRPVYKPLEDSPKLPRDSLESADRDTSSASGDASIPSSEQSGNSSQAKAKNVDELAKIKSKILGTVGRPRFDNQSSDSSSPAKRRGYRLKKKCSNDASANSSESGLNSSRESNYINEEDETIDAQNPITDLECTGEGFQNNPGAKIPIPATSNDGRRPIRMLRTLWQRFKNPV